MDIKKQIRKSLNKTRSIAEKRTKRYKENLTEKIKVNLAKGQSVQENQVLIDRVYSAKPQGFNQMQQAFQEAL